MKHYLYISDAKLDMMAAQVPRKLRDRIAAELKIDIKLFSMSLTQQPDEESLYSKLALVTEYLREHGPMGDLRDVKAYFAGRLVMTWGELPVHGSLGKQPPAIYFYGEAGAVAVGLGGSVHHAIGAASDPAAGGSLPTSTALVLLKLLYGQDPDEFGVSRPIGPRPNVWDDDELRDWDPIGLLRSGTAHSFTTEDDVEFVARRLAVWRSTRYPERMAVFGSPIYVALSDER